MNPSNRTIEEKLAIVQQLRNNSNASSGNKIINNSYKTSSRINTKQNVSSQLQEEDSSYFLVFFIIRLVICVIIFGVFAFIGYKNPSVLQCINAMITTEENGNLIDFMSPFTYTLQEDAESMPEVQDKVNTDISVPSEE